MKIIEPELLVAVVDGDVENLKKLCETRSPEYFLGQATEVHTKPNMLHILCLRQHQACIEESLERLPIRVVRKLLSQTDDRGENALHTAAGEGNLDIVKLLVNAYNRSSDDDSLVDDPSCPPWRAKSPEGGLPVQVAVCQGHDEVTAYLISVDRDVLRCADVAGSLLRFGARPTLKAIIGDLVERCSEDSDASLFLTQHRELVQGLGFLAKEDILCRAIKRNFVDVAKMILSIIDFFASLSSELPPRDPRPFHLAANFGRVEIAQLMVDEFNKDFKPKLEEERKLAAALSNPRSFEIIEQKHSKKKKENEIIEQRKKIKLVAVAFQAPWRQTDTHDHSPLYQALRSKHTEFSKSILLWDLAYLYDLTNHVYDWNVNVPDAAVLVELKKLEDDPQLSSDLYSKPSLTTLHLETFLEFLRRAISAEDASLVIRFLKQHLELLRLKDDSGRSILQYALDQDEIPVMSVLLKIDTSVINILDGENDHILMRACRKGNLNAILNICLISPYCPQEAVRHEDQSSVLHHVRLWPLEEYQKLLKIPEISDFMNKTDALGRTPLMKAIEKGDTLLAQALLERDGIDVMNIKSKEGKTAAQMLKEKSKESVEWKYLYKKMKKKHTSYIPAGTDLKGMRSTLAVVAALLATITFAAAFMIPGGFHQKYGYVIPGQKASFTVFILSDTYVMCCSMIVLCALIWSMV